MKMGNDFADQLFDQADHSVKVFFGRNMEDVSISNIGRDYNVTSASSLPKADGVVLPFSNDPTSSMVGRLPCGLPPAPSQTHQMTARI